MEVDLLASLKLPDWTSLTRVFGNAHPSIIGLLTQWWLNLDPAHQVFDGAPTHGPGNAGRADALFCRELLPVGVLEVEGSYPKENIEKIGRYFTTRRQELRGITFGILVLYTYEVRGSGENRGFADPVDKTALKTARRVTALSLGREIIIVSLHKNFERHTSGIRSTRDYYRGTLTEVRALRIRRGELHGQAILMRQCAV